MQVLHLCALFLALLLPLASPAVVSGNLRQSQTPLQQFDDSDGDASEIMANTQVPQEAVTREDIIRSADIPGTQKARVASMSLSAMGGQQQIRKRQAQMQQQAQLLAQYQAQQQAAQQAAQRAAEEAQMRARSLTSVSAQAHAATKQMPPVGITRPKGWDQCLKFARSVKAQDVTGVELVRVWKSTCEPAVQSGHATERYRLMCNSLGGAVEPYAAQLDYDVENLCDSVLAVFHDVTAVDTKAR